MLCGGAHSKALTHTQHLPGAELLCMRCCLCFFFHLGPLLPLVSACTWCVCGCAGGDSVSAVKQMDPQPAVTYMSTGGGATLELLEGQVLPGLTALVEAGRRKQQNGTGAS